MNTVNELQHRIASDSLERYSGSAVSDFQSRILITNFPSYVEAFARKRNLQILSGSAFSVVHSPTEKITLLNFGLGSPSAALVVELLSFLMPECILLLGMCGGLRRRYQIGDYLIPIASVRGEGTSNFFFPPDVPALANFHMTQACSEVLRESDETFHFGITHTTNIRFWEFDDRFKEQLRTSRVQAIEMECATLFCASYKRSMTLGALLLVSDLPLETSGVKTKESSRRVVSLYAERHVEHGVNIVTHGAKLLADHKERKHVERPPTDFYIQETPPTTL
jgi:AMP nucleosidase